MKIVKTIDEAISYSLGYLANTGRVVEAEKWQGIDSPDHMFEALNLSFSTPMPESEHQAVKFIEPNLPWAELHFQERISGVPLNPPPSHEIWPFGQKNNEKFTQENLFDHTYPERFWPKQAGTLSDEVSKFCTPETIRFWLEDSNRMNKGIRFEYGDLQDVIELLSKEKTTRQAYLPIWFPEDTGAKGGKGRVPCTLGYHFMIRHGYLHMWYTMRSCDALRHFQDDLYMAVRLGHHVIHELSGNGISGLSMGLLNFTAFSYHIFNSERKLLDKKIQSWD